MLPTNHKRVDLDPGGPPKRLTDRRSILNSKQVYFLPVNHTLRSHDRNWYEIGQAGAKSHAAKVAYQRRLSKERKAQDDHAQVTDAIPRSPGSGLLDPFVTVSAELELEDRNLLHEYLVSVPGEFYGTSAVSRFCPVRDVTLGVLSTNQILLNWAILFIRNRNNLLRHIDSAHDPSMVRQRLLTYKIMSDKLHDKESAISADSMYAMAYSALLEHRIGDERTGQKHLQACLIIRRLRTERGLTNLSYPLGTLCIPICAVVGVPDYFKSLEEVRVACSKMRCIFEALAKWKQIRVERASRPKFAVPLQHRPLLSRMLSQHMTKNSLVADRIWLTIVLSLNMASWCFHRHSDQPNELLKLIKLCFLSSNSVPKIHPTNMTLMGLLWVTFMCIDWVQPSGADQPCDVDLWMAVDVMELLTFAGQGMMMRAKHQLLVWLLDEADDPPELIPFDETFHDHLAEHVESAWLAQQRYVGASNSP